MTREIAELDYLDQSIYPRDHVDKIIENILISTARINTEGTEENIPKNGPLVVGFAPHSGWLEPFIINHLLTEKRGRTAIWIAKKENQDNVPEFLLGNRKYIFVDRKNPSVTTFKTAQDILMTDGVVASAFEGTRYGNPQDSSDVLTLTEMKPGLMKIAYDSKVPIIGVAILGTEEVLPSPEKIKEKYGTMAVVTELINAIARRDATVQVRFLEPYIDHILPNGEEPEGLAKKRFVNMHNDRLIGNVVRKIRELKPDYPFGRYEGI